MDRPTQLVSLAEDAQALADFLSHEYEDLELYERALAAATVMCALCCSRAVETTAECQRVVEALEARVGPQYIGPQREAYLERAVKSALHFLEHERELTVRAAASAAALFMCTVCQMPHPETLATLERVVAKTPATFPESDPGARSN